MVGELRHCPSCLVPGRGLAYRNTQFTASGIKLLEWNQYFSWRARFEHDYERFISKKEAYGPCAPFSGERRGDIVSGVIWNRAIDPAKTKRLVWFGRKIYLFV